MDAKVNLVTAGEASFARLHKGIWDCEQRNPEYVASPDKNICSTFFTESL